MRVLGIPDPSCYVGRLRARTGFSLGRMRSLTARPSCVCGSDAGDPSRRAALQDNRCWAVSGIAGGTAPYRASPGYIIRVDDPSSSPRSSTASGLGAGFARCAARETLARGAGAPALLRVAQEPRRRGRGWPGTAGFRGGFADSGGENVEFGFPGDVVCTFLRC